MQLLIFNVKLVIFLLVLWSLRMLTSGGFGIIFELFYGYLYLGVFCLSLILSSVIFIKNKQFAPKIPKNFLLSVLGLSIFLILFNGGACGSNHYDSNKIIIANETGNFIQRIITQESYLSTTKNWLSSEYLFYGSILNFISIFVLVLISLRNAKKLK